MVDYREAFAAIRTDPRWKRKIGLGVLIMLLPYVGVVWMLGWQMEYQRNVAWGRDERIPEWSDFSGQAMQGLRGFIAVLPYSFVMSLFTTPLVVGFSMIASLSAPSDPETWLLNVAIVSALSIVMTVGLTVVLIPFTSATTLRVALYGTFESGFQFKEIWRLMKERRSELLRAWGFSSINMAISYGVLFAYFAFVGLLIAFVPGSAEQKFLAVVALAVIGYFAYMLVGTVLGLYLGLANAHYVGRYGRAAYGLDERLAPVAATAAPAQTWEAH